jgi:hypothetical protein
MCTGKFMICLSFVILLSVFPALCAGGGGDTASKYSLPLSIDKIHNYDNFSSKIQLNDEAISLLEMNGFVVMENPFAPMAEDMTDPYDTIRESQIPIFITTDSLLHLYHIQFDETLRQIEEREFYDDLWDMSEHLLNEAELDYKTSTGDVREAARKNMIFLSVGLSLLGPDEDQLCEGSEWECSEWIYGDDYPYFKNEDLTKYSFKVPVAVRNEVQNELELIDGHLGFDTSPTFHYKEDYSQYIPRGHYTRSEKLKNYFQAMMWYGRMSFLLKGCDGPDCLVSEEDAKLQTIGASLIAQDLKEDSSTLVRWDRIYNVTSFYVGYSDDLGPYEYNEAINSVFGGSFRALDFTDDDVLRLKAELAEYRSPLIYGGTGNCVILPPFTPEQADQCLESTIGFRLMGQRFIPDSYIFQNLVMPYTGKYTGAAEPFTLLEFRRVFPRGLDVMYLLGSKRAEELLDDLNDSSYTNYSAQHEALEEEFESFSKEDWQKNLYWGWLYALMPLLEVYGDGYPAFMQTKAWQDKELTTALASWTELRHDTILYAKQSYTPRAGIAPVQPERVVGYVEPVPEFYNRLLALTNQTCQGLYEVGALDDSSKRRLDNLETMLERLVRISEDELENKELGEEDIEFINNFGKELDGIIADVDDDAKKTTIIADVHTDTNTGKVLEEGVGYVRLMIVAYEVPDGRILLGAGPVFSYYEFKHPMDVRLTDEKWREMLESNAPEKPEWDENFAV